MFKHTIMALLTIGIVVLNSCKDDDPVTTPVQGTMSLTSEYTTVALAKTSGAAAVDSIKITRARFSFKDIKFKNTVEDSVNFKAAPFILELDLTGAGQTVAVAEVPFGTYNRLEFDVHRLENSSIAGRTDTLQFSDFLKGEKYSVIIEGTYYTGGKDSAVTYRSKIDAKQKIDLDPVLTVTAESASVTTTLQISSAGWFVWNNQILEPTDHNNEGRIDENIKASIKLKKKGPN